MFPSRRRIARAAALKRSRRRVLEADAHAKARWSNVCLPGARRHGRRSVRVSNATDMEGVATRWWRSCSHLVHWPGAVRRRSPKGLGSSLCHSASRGTRPEMLSKKKEEGQTTLVEILVRTAKTKAHARQCLSRETSDRTWHASTSRGISGRTASSFSSSSRRRPLLLQRQCSLSHLFLRRRSRHVL